MSINFKELKANHDLVDVVTRFGVSLQKKGSEHYGCCPFHDDKTASLQVNQQKQIFSCFPCDKYGDIFDFLECAGMSAKEAADWLTGVSISPNFEKRKSVKTIAAAPWKQIPVMADSPAPTFKHYHWGDPTTIHKYTGPGGETLGYTCRFVVSETEKQVLPYIFATNGSRQEWRWQGFDKPRPMYGQDLMKAHPTATVIIVEGEKTCDAINKVADFTKAIAVTWCGGSQAIAHTNWQPLKGRKAIYWTDNDVQGISAMLHIHSIIGAELEKVKFIPLDNTLEKGWDAADKEWANYEEIRAFIQERWCDDIPANLSEVSPTIFKKYGKALTAWRFNQIGESTPYYFGTFEGEEKWHFFKEPEEEVVKEAKKPRLPKNQTPAPPNDPDKTQTPEYEWEQYFSILGFDKCDDGLRFFFFIKSTNTICAYAGHQLSKVTLITLAPLMFWEKSYPARQTGFDLSAAQNFLINKAKSKGSFSDKNIRGRGAWRDNGKIVIHTGRDLVINGVRHPLGTIKTKYVYELSPDLQVHTESPATVSKANKLMEVVEIINWQRSIDAYLFAGWCIIAPFCGVLKWRPHIWLTGSAGTGKSWILLKIARFLMGEFAIAVQGATTAAGIRQKLKHDALPIIFDEAEGEDKFAQERIQNNLELARGTSTDDGGIIIKGTSGHDAATFIIRSCFGFASIGEQVSQQSDRRRVTVFNIKDSYDKTEAKARWEKLQAAYDRIMTEDFAQSMQARTIKQLPVILKNAETFGNAAASVLGEQYIGDQLGSMLAGAHSLYSNEIVTLDYAKKWILERSHELKEEKNINETRDDISLLNFILDQKIDLQLQYSNKKRTIGELIAVAMGEQFDENDATDIQADTTLRRYGIKYENQHVVFSNSSEYLRRILKDTAWSKNHHKILLRVEGAEEVSSTRFSGGMQTRAVKIPEKMFKIHS